MNATTAIATDPPEAGPEAWTPPSKGRVGMACLILAESAIFIIFVVAYVFYLGRDLSGPTPRQVLELPILNSICLLASSVTITFAVRALQRGAIRAFAIGWLSTLLLGGYFLFGTALEWKKLIEVHGLTLQTNLFGTTFYSLVGLHACHVIVGLVMLLIVFALTVAGAVRREHADRTEVLALYWHFVDAIWIVVFTVVYVIGR